MRAVVNYNLCEGNGVCAAVCPEVFEVSDDDRVYLLAERPGEELRAKVETAVRRCPRQALALVED